MIRKPYIVVRRNKNGSLNPANSPFQHDTLSAALDEAERLSLVNAPAEFVVFSAVTRTVSLAVSLSEPL